MIDISNKIEPSTVAVVEAIDLAARNLGIPFFVVGATARDMLLRDAFHLSPRRATHDIDIAIRVADWNEYNTLTNSLVASGAFKHTAMAHRLLFNENEPVDIMPFGPIAGEKRSIAWPPSEDMVMGVLGFEEAFRSANPVTVRRTPRLDIPVATLAGLALMKLISWDETYPERGKDGEDFYYIIESYADAGNSDRIFHEASDLLNTEAFDLTRAGARLLGRDMKQLAEMDAFQKAREILSRESDPAGSLRLITDIIGTNITLQERFDEVLGLMRSVREGIMD